MKKIISLILILACMLLVCCVLVSCNEENDSSYGIVADGDKTYFIAEGGAILIENGKAASVATPSLSTAPKSEKFKSVASAEEYFVISSGKITGLTERGKSCAVLMVPSDVSGIAAGAFNGSTLKSLVIAGRPDGKPLNLANGAFAGTNGLNVFISEIPDNVTVGKQLLDNTTGVKFFISADEYSTYKTHYYWGNFSNNLSKY